MWFRRAWVVAIAMAPVMAAAQQFLTGEPGAPVDPNIRFEVVAIRPVEGINERAMMRMTPGGYESSVPLGILVRQAVQKADYQIFGAPNWMDSERYSIRAKVPEGAPQGAMNAMMLNLLKDRFQLVIHLETRELPIFNLVLAREDGRLGPELKPTPAECQAMLAERAAAAKAAAGRGGPPPAFPPLPGPGEALPCGFGMVGPGNIRISARTLAQFIPTLSDLSRRPVIDKTGLTGMYDFSLKFAPDSAGLAGPFALLAPPTPPPVDPDAPSFSTAVQEQLGLRLENARGPVEVVVIDKLERPTFD
jgi:uncharacterized protein (TIGR03435 family)